MRAPVSTLTVATLLAALVVAAPARAETPGAAPRAPVPVAPLHHEPHAGASGEAGAAHVVSHPAGPGKIQAPLAANRSREQDHDARAATEAAKARQGKLATFDAPLVRTPPPGMKLSGARYGNTLLITPAQLKALPRGTVLRSIADEEIIVGIDRIDGDTPGGHLAYGFPVELGAQAVRPSLLGRVLRLGSWLRPTPTATATPTPTPPPAARPEVRTVSQEDAWNEIVAAAAKARQEKLAALDVPLVRTPPAGMKLSGVKLDNVSLITPDQLKQLPRGTVLRSISGNEAIVGVDEIDGDTRGGHLAFGFPTP